MTVLRHSEIRHDPHEPCPFCGCAATAQTPRKARAKVSACAELATCWQWDHDCYARRMRAGKRATFTPAGYAPASLRGSIVPNLTIAA